MGADLEVRFSAWAGNVGLESWSFGVPQVIYSRSTFMILHGEICGAKPGLCSQIVRDGSATNPSGRPSPSSVSLDVLAQS